MTSFAATQHILDTYLYLTWEIVSKEGSQINVNEAFTVRFTIENKADRDALGSPHLIFENVHLRIKPTDYASLITRGTRTTTRGTVFPFPQQTLHATQSTSMDIEFKAERNMADEGWWPWVVDQTLGGLEKIADVRIYADFRAVEGKTDPKSLNVEIDSD